MWTAIRRLSLDSRAQIAGIVVIACALRVVSAIPFSAHVPDEIWQYLEPAWRINEGYSVMTWEQRIGLRSWLLPEIISVPMAFGHWLSPNTQLHLLTVRLSLAAFSLSIVWAAFRIGDHRSRLHALCAAFVTATWAEFVYMAPRALTDPVGACFFMLGAAVLLTGSGRRDYWAGLLLGLSFLIRIQLAPAIAALVLFSMRDWRHRPLRLIAGGLIALAIDSAANIHMGAPPLLWIWKNIDINFFHDKADQYGVSGPWTYLGYLIRRWQWLCVPILLLALIGARRFPSLFAAAIVHIVVHSLIAHKEWRFDFLFNVLIITLAGIGTGSVISWFKGRRMRVILTVLLLTGWLAGSVFVATRKQMMEAYDRFRPLEATMFAAGRIPRSCNIAVYEPGPYLPAAYSLIGKKRGIYVFGPRTIGDLRATASAFGAIVEAAGQPHSLPTGFAYHEGRCPGSGRDRYEWCVFKRARTERDKQCTGSPPAADQVNRWMQRVHF